MSLSLWGQCSSNGNRQSATKQRSGQGRKTPAQLHRPCRSARVALQRCPILCAGVPNLPYTVVNVHVSSFPAQEAPIILNQ
jgi:hypothetical protein